MARKPRIEFPEALYHERAGRSGMHIVGAAPTGKQVTMSRTVTFLIQEGRLQEEWSHWDTLGLLQQVGVIPK